DQILIKYGSEPEQMLEELLDKAQIVDDIPKKSALIGIKPNLVLAKPSEFGATTCPRLVESLVVYLKTRGFDNIVILEGSWVGDRTPKAFKVCGYDEISKRHDIPLIDLQRDDVESRMVEGEKINYCKKAASVDYMINVPVLKGHCQTKITCALKNMKGCIPDKEKRRFHTMRLHKPIAYLNKVIKQNLIIVDGIIGDLNFEEGGNPVQMNRVIVGKDPVLIDCYIAQLLGYDKEDIPYIRMSEALGVGSSRLDDRNILELNKDNSITMLPKTGLVKQLEKHIVEDMACSSCYASLIHALDRLKDRGELDKIKGKIHIGQGYKGKTSTGTGIGVCTKGFTKNVEGCPPKAKDILDFLLDDIKKEGR
ncbi:MAG TPA: DUF362 domain-containing protein, partial [Anaerovoracaceae bacterium]|nr:DUF362 domain-containing protein [Anaerovoracaceae bacterium]